MKTVIFGASGIIGQHMRLCVPADVQPIWMRKTSDTVHTGLDLNNCSALTEFLEKEKPKSIVNLAGENRPDVVEKSPDDYWWINTTVPSVLSRWCESNNARYIHVSTQAVFDGLTPPYGPESHKNPVNQYGYQKHVAELLCVRPSTLIVRPTFVLGIRPILTGRENPIEQMLTQKNQRHVDDRWFSVSYADDVAQKLWKYAIRSEKTVSNIVHIGSGRVSRFDLAQMVSPEIPKERVKHADFPSIAPRPIDTTYESADNDISAGIARCRSAFFARRTRNDVYV